MSVIIRLQNLPWNANAIDIRQFFQGLSIPDGGVHIVGGDKGDAFIAFSTDEDARLAMQKDGGRIHSSQVKLLLSSKTEMQNVIAAAKGAGPPPVQQVSSGGIKEPAYYERPAVPPATLYGSQKVPDLSFQSGFQGGDNYRDRPRDYPVMLQVGPSRLAEERFPGRGHGETPAGAPLPGGLALGPSSYQPPPVVDGRQVPGGMSRPSHGGDMGGYHQQPPLDARQIPGAMSRPSHGGDMGGSVRLQFGEVGPGIQDALVNVRGQPTRLPDLRRQNEPTVEERRRFNEFESTKFVDERAPVFPGDRNLGPGGRDFHRSNVDMAGDTRDFGPPNNGRNVGRPNIPEDTGRPGMIRYDTDRPSPVERNFDSVRPINRPGRDFFEGSDYPRNTMLQDSARYDDHMENFGGSRSRGLDDRGSRQGGNNNFNGRPGASLAPSVGRSVTGQNEFFELNRQPLIPEVPESRFSNEPRLQNRDIGLGSTHIPDLREVIAANSNRRFENQYPRPRDHFPEDIPPPKRLRPEDPRSEIRPESYREPFNGFPKERPPVDRELDHGRHANWPVEGREVPNMRRPENNEDPREQLTFRCSNFPRTFNYKEVRRFFTGCEIPREGLKLVNDRAGLRSGTAYVMFMNNRGAMTALGMNGKMAMDCKVRIERCSFKEYDSIVDSQTAPPRHRSQSPQGRRNASEEVPGVFYFVVKKLPPKTERADVKRFFGKFRIAADGGPFMELTSTGSGFPTGNALLAIEKLKNPGEVIKVLHRTPLHGSKIDVIAVNKVEYEERTKRSRQLDDSKSKEKKDVNQEAMSKDAPMSNKSGAPEGEKKSYFIHIRGLPFSADAAMVQDFFRGLDIAPNGIRIVVNSEGRAEGDGYVEFTSLSDQKKAMEMDKKYIGRRYIELRTISRQAMISEYHSKQKQCGGPPVEVEGAIRNPPDEVNDNHLCAMRNLHPNTQLEDILDFFRGCRPIVDSIKLQYKDGQPTGDGLVAFSTPQEAESAVRSKNQHYLLGRLITLSIWSNKK